MVLLYTHSVHHERQKKGKNKETKGGTKKWKIAIYVAVGVVVLAMVAYLVYKFALPKDRRYAEHKINFARWRKKQTNSLENRDLDVSSTEPSKISSKNTSLSSSTNNIFEAIPQSTQNLVENLVIQMTNNLEKWVVIYPELKKKKCNINDSVNVFKDLYCIYESIAELNQMEQDVTKLCNTTKSSAASTSSKSVCEEFLTKHFENIHKNVDSSLKEYRQLVLSLDKKNYWKCEEFMMSFDIYRMARAIEK